MAKPAVKNPPLLYEQLESLPENLVGEIIDGVLHTHPRPSGPHALAGSSLGYELIGPYQRGRGGPGGWWILIEPEIHFELDTILTVPDLAGWRRERMPELPVSHRFRVVPDWICEILSPTTAKKDRTKKMPLYEKYDVSYLWLLDPLDRILEVFELINDRWTLQGIFKDEDAVRAVPFQETEIKLSDLWVPN